MDYDERPSRFLLTPSDFDVDTIERNCSLSDDSKSEEQDDKKDDGHNVDAGIDNGPDGGPVVLLRADDCELEFSDLGFTEDSNSEMPEPVDVPGGNRSVDVWEAIIRDIDSEHSTFKDVVTIPGPDKSPLYVSSTLLPEWFRLQYRSRVALLLTDRQIQWIYTNHRFIKDVRAILISFAFDGLDPIDAAKAIASGRPIGIIRAMVADRRTPRMGGAIEPIRLHVHPTAEQLLHPNLRTVSGNVENRFSMFQSVMAILHSGLNELLGRNIGTFMLCCEHVEIVDSSLLLVIQTPTYSRLDGADLVARWRNNVEIEADGNDMLKHALSSYLLSLAPESCEDILAAVDE
jgi:hypothetical protein